MIYTVMAERFRSTENNDSAQRSDYTGKGRTNCCHSHASRVARTLGDVSYTTVWRVADTSS
jgi:hypothetical protein